MEEAIRKRILDLVRAYYFVRHAPRPFVPGQHKVQYAGRVFDEKEMVAAVETLLDFYLSGGGQCEQFEREFSSFLGVGHARLVNSGSSANLLAVSSLFSSLLQRPIVPGDEVITPLLTFPTTVNPLLQNGLVPVFLDVELGSYTMSLERLRDALSPRTRAVFVPHMLGNPPDMDVLVSFTKEHGLYLLEDCCDALGSRFGGKFVGTFGDMASCSFYPAHHMTMGEGGVVFMNHGLFSKIVASLRDWGRDCWCAPGKSNTCGKRFSWQHASLPFGYDHKYSYSHIGYNLKALDVQAAIGLEQLKKVPGFIVQRKENFRLLYDALLPYSRYLILPRWHDRADVSWFAFPITVRADAGFRSQDFVSYLEKNGVETRPFFGGNILRQPAYRGIQSRVVGGTDCADIVTHSGFFIGVYPGITEEKMSYMISTLKRYLDGSVS